MLRYLRLYFYFIEFSFGRAMEFRVDFYFRVFMDVVFYAVSFGFFKIIYLHSPEIGGWNESQAMIFVAAFVLIDAVQMTLFANNMWIFPQLVNKGDLDYYLTRPVSAFFILNLRDFAVNSFLNFVVAAALMAWALATYPEALGVGRIINFLFLVLSGCFLGHLVRLLFILPVFWTHASRGLDTIYWSLGKFAERPHGIYRGFVRLTFLTILPFAVMASLPTQTLFVKSPLSITVYCFGVCAAFLLLVLGVWNLALRNYSSASS